jgi:hypothetical protein
VRLKFRSPRPASFAVFKKNRQNPALPDENPDKDWIPWQYYSATCRDTYKMPDATSIIQPRDGKTKVREDRALCTSEYSDMTPLAGANVAFSTLEGRVSAFNFEYSPGKEGVDNTCVLDVQFGCAFHCRCVFDVIFEFSTLKMTSKTHSTRKRKSKTQV